MRNKWLEICEKSVLTFFFSFSLIKASEKTTHWQWYCDNSFPGAWSTTLQPKEHPLPLPARVCHREGARALHWQCLLQVPAGQLPASSWILCREMWWKMWVKEVLSRVNLELWANRHTDMRMKRAQWGSCWGHSSTQTHTHIHVKHLEIILELPSHFLFILFIKRMLEDYFGIDRNRTKEKNPLPLFAQMIWSSEFMLHFWNWDSEKEGLSLSGTLGNILISYLISVQQRNDRIMQQKIKS